MLKYNILTIHKFKKTQGIKKIVSRLKNPNVGI